MGNQEAVFIPQKKTDPQLRTNKLQEAADKYQLEQNTFELPEIREIGGYLFVTPNGKWILFNDVVSVLIYH